MKYTSEIFGTSKLRKLFIPGKEYDDRAIAEIAKANGLKAIRPNGDERIRGSRRLQIIDPKTKRPFIKFTAV